MEISKTNALRGRLGEFKMTIGKFASLMGISRNRAFAILNGERAYTAVEIEKACNILSIPTERIPDYFFGTLVTKTETPKESEV